MKQSRNLAMMFLLGAFLTGGVLGFSADRYMNRDQVCTSRATGGSGSGLREVLAQSLGLDSAQNQAVDLILDERAAQYRRAMEPLRPRMDSIKYNAREQIRRVLREDQIRQFDALIVDMNDSTRKNDEDS
ncbi:MAG: hypothetical protein ACT4OZ_06940 [Gemmatimonadota bacterium]